MLTYLENEEEYKKQLGTDNVPKDFKNLNIEASAYLNHKTFGRVNKNNVPEEVKYVICLIIDLINEENDKLSKIGNLKSQNIEGWSESYSTPEEIKNDYEEKKYSTLKKYLWNVIGTDGNPLLYCGVY
nr:MAG TPA: Head Tail Connector Protein [Caudoviricetes sp.]